MFEYESLLDVVKCFSKVREVVYTYYSNRNNSFDSESQSDEENNNWNLTDEKIRWILVLKDKILALGNIKIVRLKGCWGESFDPEFYLAEKEKKLFWKFEIVDEKYL